MQRLVTLEPVPHLPVMPTVHRTMGRLRKGSIGMPKAKKSKVVRFEERSEEPQEGADDCDPTPSSPPSREAPEQDCAAPSSPGTAVVKACRGWLGAALQREKEAHKELTAAKKDEELQSRLFDYAMHRTERAMKEKGYRGSYWEPRLNKAEERWRVSQFKRAYADAKLAHCMVYTLEVKLMLKDAKLRAVQRRLRRRRVFGVLRW